MSDTINRQAAVDVVNGIDSGFVKYIEDLPSAEPDVIRCKDCKYAHLTYSGDCKFCDKWTDEFGIPEEVYLDGAFFCGYAKRREDE